MWFHLPWLEVSLLFLLSQVLFWGGVLGGLVHGGVPFQQVERQAPFWLWNVLEETCGSGGRKG